MCVVDCSRNRSRRFCRSRKRIRLLQQLEVSGVFLEESDPKCKGRGKIFLLISKGNLVENGSDYFNGYKNVRNLLIVNSRQSCRKRIFHIHSHWSARYRSHCKSVERVGWGGINANHSQGSITSLGESHPTNHKVNNDRAGFCDRPRILRRSLK